MYCAYSRQKPPHQSHNYLPVHHAVDCRVTQQPVERADKAVFQLGTRCLLCSRIGRSGKLTGTPVGVEVSRSEPGVGAGGFHEFGATDAFAGQGSRRGSVGVFRERSSAGGSNFQLFANLGDPRKTFLCLHLCVVCACVSVSV
jgi:hypothetical protein